MESFVDFIDEAPNFGSCHTAPIHQQSTTSCQNTPKNGEIKQILAITFPWNYERLSNNAIRYEMPNALKYLTLLSGTHFMYNNYNYGQTSECNIGLYPTTNLN